MTFELLTIGADPKYNDYYLYVGFLRGRSLFSLHYIGDFEDELRSIGPTFDLDLFYFHVIETDDTAH